MKRFIQIVTILWVTLHLYSCDSDGNDCIVGTGAQEEFDLELTDFDAISVSGAVNIELTQGPEFRSILITQANIFEILETGVSGGVLFVRQDANRCISTPTSMTLRVTAPDYTGISISGASLISNTNDLDLDAFSISCSGVVISELSGTCTSQDLSVSGAGDFLHFELVSDDVDIEVSGDANFDLTVENNLDIRVSGSSVVNYKGSPVITQDVSGSLELNNVN